MITDSVDKYSELYFQNDSIVEVYFGSDLVFVKEKEENIYDPQYLYVKGKFTDESTEDNWYLFINTVNGQINIADYVDKKTKEFDIKLEIKYGQQIFNSNKAIEKIYSISIPNNINKLDSAFNFCLALNEIRGLDKCDITNINSLVSMFYNCPLIERLNLSNWNLENVTNINFIFSYSNNLKYLNLKNWDFKNIDSVLQPFNGCDSLTTVVGDLYNIKFSFSLKDSPLTRESALVFLNGLANVEETQTITFSKETFASLTEEDKQIAYNKNWTIAS